MQRRRTPDVISNECGQQHGLATLFSTEDPASLSQVKGGAPLSMCTAAFLVESCLYVDIRNVQQLIEIRKHS